MNNNYKKLEADNLEKLDIRILKEKGLLNGHRSAEITFRDGLKANLDIHAHPSCGYINLSYLQKLSEWENYDLFAKLNTSCCYFGGMRYWFACPGINNEPCNERVGILYRVGNYFACRHCHNLTYLSRSVRKISIKAYLKEVKLKDKVEKLKHSIRKSYYAGKPTKKLIKLDFIYGKYQSAKLKNDIIIEKTKQKRYMKI